MPIILSGSRFAYVDPMARLFYDEEDRCHREVKTINFKKEIGFKNFSDFDYYKHLPDVFKFDGAAKYPGTLFRFPFRNSLTRNSDLLSSNCFDSKKINGLISAFKKEAAMMLAFLKNVSKITFEVLDGTTKTDSYVVEATYSSLEKYKQRRETFLTNVKKEIKKGTFSPHLVTYELLIKKTSRSDDQPENFHYCVSEVFGYECGGDFMHMIKDTDLAYVPLVGVAYRLGKPHSLGHIFCGLPLPFSQESLTGLPVHINGYFALGPDRKDLKWKSISTEKSDDKSVLWNIALLVKLIPRAYLNLLKFLMGLKLQPSQVYSAWPCISDVYPKWKVVLAGFYSQLMKERCIFSNAIKTWEVPSQVQILRSKSTYFKGDVDFKVIYDFLMKTKYKFAVVPDNVFGGIQNPIVMDRSSIQDLVAANMGSYLSCAQEDQNILLSFIIRNEVDARKFFNKLPLRMVQGPPQRLTSWYDGQVYLLVYPYTKEFLPTNERVIDRAFYSKENVKVLELIARTGI